MTATNIVQSYVPSVKNVQSQKKGTGSKSRTDEPEDSFGAILNQSSKPAKGRDEKATEETDEKSESSKPAESAESKSDKRDPEIKPGEAIPLSDLQILTGEIKQLNPETNFMVTEISSGEAETMTETAIAPEIVQTRTADGEMQLADSLKSGEGLAEGQKNGNPEKQLTETGKQAEVQRADVPVTPEKSPKPAENSKTQESTVQTPATQVQTAQGVKTSDAGEVPQTFETQTGNQMARQTGVPPRAASGENQDLAATAAAETDDKTVLTKMAEDKNGYVYARELSMQENLNRTDGTAGAVTTIKVAEPFHQADAELLNQLSDTIQDGIKNGKEILDIQLNPEHLGKISIKISMVEDGIKVLLSCDNQKTQGILAEKATGLGRIVEENLNGPVTVEMKEDSYWNQQKDAADENSGNRGREEHQEKQKHDENNDFIQQLRLGLFADKLVI